MQSSRCFLLIASLLWVITCAAHAAGPTFYVAPNGNDAWSGKRPGLNWRKTDGPFATLQHAVDVAHGARIEVRCGTYTLEKPLQLGPQNSGLTLAAYGKEKPVISGGHAVTGWKPVTDPAVLERLDESVRGKVLQAELGPVAGDRLELFFQNQPMTVARWPNTGFVKIVDVVEQDGHQIHGNKGSKTGKFIYDGDRPNRWTGEKDLWLHGYWFWDWADQRQQVTGIDTTKKIITLAPPQHSYGYRKGQWYYAFNALTELDAPGEWYLDHATGRLYFLPPAPIEQGVAVVSVLPNLVTIQNATNMTVRGFTLEAVQGTAVTSTGGTQNQIVGCIIRNVGSWAVKVACGTACRVADCEIYATGDGGIALDGGDRKTLTPAGHVAENNHIHHYSRWNRMYQPAIHLGGVGNRAAHNLIHDAPHEAIAFGGNDQIIEFNEIHHVCTESNDAGAIYNGRDWTGRGTVIRHNYLHDITGFEGRGCVGVYLDDMLSGITIAENLFRNVTSAAFIGGGRDCVIEHNIFVDCKPAIHVDARALGWAANSVPTTMTQRLNAMPYKQPPWSERYPALVNILDDEPAAPKGNVIACNLCIGGKWDNIEKKARPLVKFEDNQLDVRPDSPEYKRALKQIHADQTGLKR